MLALRDLRKARGLTQQQLADMVGVLNVSISNYERGTQMPDILTLKKIANVLGVSTDTLLGLDPPEKGKDVPQTIEARSVSFAMDTLPQDQRELILKMVKAMFPNNFNERTNDDDT